MEAIPMLATLELFDYLMIALTTALVQFVFSVTAGPSRSPELRRLRSRIDLLMTHHGLELPMKLSPEVQALARDPSQKIEAIRLHREQTGSGLADAKEDVEDFLSASKTRSKS